MVSCPACGAALNRLGGRDGWAVESAPCGGTNRWVVERRRLATVWACPACEHVQVGRVDVRALLKDPQARARLVAFGAEGVGE